MEIVISLDQVCPNGLFINSYSLCLSCILFISVIAGVFKRHLLVYKFSGQQAGVKLFLWKSTASSSGLKITAPSKFMSLFNNEISWAGIEALKPTCQSLI